MASPPGSTDTRTSLASPPSPESLTGEENGPPMLAVAASTTVLVPSPNSQETVSLPFASIATSGLVPWEIKVGGLNDPPRGRNEMETPVCPLLPISSCQTTTMSPLVSIATAGASGRRQQILSSGDTGSPKVPPAKSSSGVWRQARIVSKCSSTTTASPSGAIATRGLDPSRGQNPQLLNAQLPAVALPVVATSPPHTASAVTSARPGNTKTPSVSVRRNTTRGRRDAPKLAKSARRAAWGRVALRCRGAVHAS